MTNGSVRFGKNTSNFMSAGVGTVGTLINGLDSVTFGAWFKMHSFDTTVNNNRIFVWVVDASLGGGSMAVHDGTNPVLRIGARSQAADSFLVANSVRYVSVGRWCLGGATLDYTNGLIYVWLDAALNSVSTAAFGSATYTQGTATAYDGIGTLLTSVPGVSGGIANMFDGLISNIFVFPGRLSSSQWRKLYAGTSPQNLSVKTLLHMQLNRSTSAEVCLAGSGVTGTVTGTLTPDESIQLVRRKSA